MTRVVMYDDAIRRLFYDPLGPVGQKLTRHARNIEEKAKAKAPSRDGDLRDSIETRALQVGGVPEPGWEATMHVDVGTSITKRGFPYGRAQELGVGAGGEFELPAHQRKSTKGYKNAFLRPALNEEFGR